MYIILISWVTPTPKPLTPTPYLIIIFPIVNFKNKSRANLINRCMGGVLDKSSEGIPCSFIGESILYSKVLKNWKGSDCMVYYRSE